LTEYFPQNHGGRVFHGTACCHASAAKKPRLAARKIAQIPVAFSLPQDLSMQLMFGAARFGEPALGASRGLEFHIAPRRRRSQHRLGTPHKCFNPHRFFDTTRRLAAPCGLNTCSGAVFRKHRRAGGHGLPLVCRKAPEVRRKTWHLRAARRIMQRKCFNRQLICIRRNRIFFESSLRANGSRECAPDDRLREAIQSAAKQDWIASSQVLLAMTGVSIS
jgi:hypothetical protein